MKTYIGDGVYAEWNGYALVLTAEDGIKVTETIVLESREWEQLKAFVERIGK